MAFWAGAFFSSPYSSPHVRLKSYMILTGGGMTSSCASVNVTMVQWCDAELRNQKVPLLAL